MAPSLLTARDLCRSIGDRTLFAGVDVDLAEGATLFVRGPSGSGKTLFLRLLAWLDPGEGEVRLDGRTPAEWGVPQWRRQIAYMTQQPPVMPGTPSCNNHSPSERQAA